MIAELQKEFDRAFGLGGELAHVAFEGREDFAVFEGFGEGEGLAIDEGDGIPAGVHFGGIGNHLEAEGAGVHHLGFTELPLGGDGLLDEVVFGLIARFEALDVVLVEGFEEFGILRGEGEHAREKTVGDGVARGALFALWRDARDLAPLAREAARRASLTGFF